VRKYFLIGTVLSTLALLGVVGFGGQSMTFGKTLGQADAATAWGGCTGGWVEILNGACTTWGPNNCSWDSIYGCVNECAVNCTPVNTYTAGGDLYGGIVDLQCNPFMLPLCDGSDGDCTCTGPTSPYPCQEGPVKFNNCIIIQ
jgi:hypothetical protein